MDGTLPFLVGGGRARIRALSSGMRVDWGAGGVSFLFLDTLLHFLSLLLDDMRGMQLSPRVGSPPGPPGDLEDDEGLKHLQQV